MINRCHCNVELLQYKCNFAIMKKGMTARITTLQTEATCMTFNLDKCNNLLKNPPQAATLRVFFWLALNFHQQTGFVRTTKKYLAQSLNLDAKSLYRALKWLQDNYIVHQRRCHGYFEFMLSPYFVEWGSDRQARLDEWNNRWRLSNQRKRK